MHRKRLSSVVLGQRPFIPPNTLNRCHCSCRNLPPHGQILNLFYPEGLYWPHLMAPRDPASLQRSTAPSREWLALGYSETFVEWLKS